MISEQALHNTKKSFISGVALLTASAAAVKVIGVFYKIPLVHLIGIEGMAYFLAAYHVYTLLFMISTAGLPVAVSILVSKRRAAGDIAGGEAVFRSSLKLFSLLGALCTAVMFFGADAIAASIKIPEAALCLRAIAPALFFISVGSAVRGYFQGCGVMYPTGISQVIESAGKLCLGLLFTYYATERGEHLHVVAAYAIAGITVGSALSTVYLLLIKYKKRRSDIKILKNTRGILKEIVRIAAPITLGAAVMSLTGAVDTALISSRLQSAGFEPSAANSMYSSYGNLSIPLFNLVPSFISPIAVAMAPMLADAAERGDRERERGVLTSAIRLCALIAIPASLGLAVFGEPILGLLYSDQTEAIKLAAPLLSLLSPAVFFSCMITVTNSALQSYRRERMPIISMLVGAVIKIVVEYILLAIPQVNIYGAPISTLCCNFAIVFLNLYFTERYSCGADGAVSKLIKPMIAALPATLGATAAFFTLLHFGISPNVATLAAVIIDVILYVLVAAWNGSIEEDDLDLLPRGEKIIKIMKKLRLLRNDNEQGRKNNFAQGQGKI